MPNAKPHTKRLSEIAASGAYPVQRPAARALSPEELGKRLAALDDDGLARALDPLTQEFLVRLIRTAGEVLGTRPAARPSKG